MLAQTFWLLTFHEGGCLPFEPLMLPVLLGSRNSMHGPDQAVDVEPIQVHHGNASSVRALTSLKEEFAILLSAQLSELQVRIMTDFSKVSQEVIGDATSICTRSMDRVHIQPATGTYLRKHDGDLESCCEIDRPTVTTGCDAAAIGAATRDISMGSKIGDCAKTMCATGSGLSSGQSSRDFGTFRQFQSGRSSSTRTRVPRSPTRDERTAARSSRLSLSSDPSFYTAEGRQSGSLKVSEAWNNDRLGSESKVSIELRDTVYEMLMESGVAENNCPRTTTDSGTVIKDQQALCLALHPESGTVAACEVGGGICSIYDLIMLPLQVSFETNSSEELKAIKWVMASLWTFDMARSFLTGFHHRTGVVEMRFKHMACHYMKGAFALDVLLLTVDWISLLVLASSSQPTHFAKILRTLRVVRVLRVLRVSKALTTIRFRIRSEYSQMAAGLLKIFLKLFLVIHYLACLWNLVSVNSMGIFSDEAMAAGLEPTHSTKQIPQKYLQCVCWTFAQFGFGAHDVHPETKAELITSIMINCTGMFVLPFVCGVVVDLFQQLHNATVCFSHGEELLRRFCCERHISVNLHSRIRKLLIMRQKTMYRLDVDDIDIFKQLPKSMRRQLNAELYCPVLVCHPLFSLWRCTCPGDFLHVCSCIAQRGCFELGQEVFMEGTRAADMFFLTFGSFQYLQRHGETMDVATGSWVCEASLWVEWDHRGRLVATISAEVVALTAAEFHLMLKSRPSQHSQMAAYARCFVQRVNGGLLEVTDLGSRHDVEVLRHMAEVCLHFDNSWQLSRANRRSLSVAVGSPII